MLTKWYSIPIMWIMKQERQISKLTHLTAVGISKPMTEAGGSRLKLLFDTTAIKAWKLQ